MRCIHVIEPGGPERMQMVDVIGRVAFGAAEPPVRRQRDRGKDIAGAWAHATTPAVSSTAWLARTCTVQPAPSSRVAAASNCVHGVLAVPL